jgi:ferric-dicitrate binding protein FerR (iron transport regulator)
MEAITASLERSLQNCSLNNNNQQNGRRRRRKDNTTDAAAAAAAAAGTRISSTSSSSSDDHHHHISNSSDTALELNSHISLPYHWEQCLDLKVLSSHLISSLLISSFQPK